MEVPGESWSGPLMPTGAHRALAVIPVTSLSSEVLWVLWVTIRLCQGDMEPCWVTAWVCGAGTEVGSQEEAGWGAGAGASDED